MALTVDVGYDTKLHRLSNTVPLEWWTAAFSEFLSWVGYSQGGGKLFLSDTSRDVTLQLIPHEKVHAVVWSDGARPFPHQWCQLSM